MENELKGLSARDQLTVRLREAQANRRCEIFDLLSALINSLFIVVGALALIKSGIDWMIFSGIFTIYWSFTSIVRPKFEDVFSADARVKKLQKTRYIENLK